MIDRSVATLDRGLFLAKGEARPTPDYVPRLKTEEPAHLAPVPGADVVRGPVAEAPAAGGGNVGLDGLIRRRVAPRQLPEQRVAFEHGRAEAEAEAREAERMRRTVAEQIDSGLVYEYLSRGLPMPDLGRVLRGDSGAPDYPASFEEAARERIARPSPQPDGSETPEPPRRRKLTARLGMGDFARFKRYTDESGRTYQDVLATATISYLDQVADENGAPVGSRPRPAPEPPMEAGHRDRWLRVRDD
jgi:hypothetical protein